MSTTELMLIQFGIIKDCRTKDCRKYMKTIEVAVIRDVTDYENALKRIHQIFNAEPGSDEFYELKMLSMEVESYEEENIEFPETDPIDIVEFVLEQHGLKQNALVGILGDKTTVSKILNRRRYLTLEMIRNFCSTFHIPVEALIQEYKLNNEAQPEMS